jgi:hypothetical protein
MVAGLDHSDMRTHSQRVQWPATFQNSPVYAHDYDQKQVSIQQRKAPVACKQAYQLPYPVRVFCHPSDSHERTGCMDCHLSSLQQCGS